MEAKLAEIKVTTRVTGRVTSRVTSLVTRRVTRRVTHSTPGAQGTGGEGASAQGARGERAARGAGISAHPPSILPFSLRVPTADPLHRRHEAGRFLEHPQKDEGRRNLRNKDYLH